MGYPSSIFQPEPPASCICPICHDVLQQPASCKECGHTFCRDCIETSLEKKASCPSCRVEVTGVNPNYFAQETIGGFAVKCPEHGSEETGGSDDEGDGGGRKRRRIQSSSQQDERCLETDFVADGCSWRGQLKDLEDHKKECRFVSISCSVEGCNHQCRRKEMEDHLSGASSFLQHIDLMKTSIAASIESKFDEKLKIVNQNMEEFQRKTMLEMNHLRYVNSCRDWIENKPDALFDFEIYKIKSKSGQYIVGLLCGIPGPADSSWEGALIPVVFRYGMSMTSRPRCKLPPDFYSIEAHFDGNMRVPIIGYDHLYEGSETLPEILFSAQQVLIHPNYNSPMSLEAFGDFLNQNDSYHIRIMKEANEVYTKANLFQNYRNINTDIWDGHEHDVELDEEEIIERANRLCKKDQTSRERPKPPPFKESADFLRNKHSFERYSECRCSCCAWGQTFWDDQRKMRFIFQH